MKNISILGSTGSIGTQALDIISRFPEKFSVVGLTGNENTKLLKEQIKKFNPKAVCVFNKKKAEELASKISIPVYNSVEGLIKIAEMDENDLVLTAVVGAVGLLPTICAIRKKKDIALANKETLVIGGNIVMKEAKKHGITIMPVDSEHSAIFQCLAGESLKSVERLILTCSGGPFRGKKKDELKNVAIKEVLNHPKWNMGKKITVDSATLMNKGFEVIEARWLFGFPPEKIKVIVHPQAIIHSMVEYKDGTVIAQLAEPDARLPIQYALCYPERIKRVIRRIEFRELTFEEPDLETFPCLAYAIDALKIGGTMPCVLNAANEIAVTSFLNGEIPYLHIPKTIKRVMDSHESIKSPSLQDLTDIDREIRIKTREIIKNA
ncbi:MAG: 1-deoxy-D-xylulose-5-phosphate reductoisomerase [Candidatus Woesearchaeota archaeon]